MNEQSGAFSSLAVELVVHVFAIIPSFHDALSLAATCQRLQNIWDEHRPQLCKLIAARCEPYARQLLVDQNRRAFNLDVSDRDVSRMIMNDAVVYDGLRKLEKVANVPRVDDHHPKRNTVYGGIGFHPWKSLTPTERLRFRRAYYQVWSLLELDKAQRQTRVESMRLRELYYARDVTTIKRAPVGLPLGYFTSLRYYDQCSVGDIIGRRIRAIWEQEYGPGVTAPGAQFSIGLPSDIRMIWDHAQHSLWNSICWSSPRGPQESKYEEPKLHLWDAEEGDELLIQEVTVKPVVGSVDAPAPPPQ